MLNGEMRGEGLSWQKNKNFWCLKCLIGKGGEEGTQIKVEMKRNVSIVDHMPSRLKTGLRQNDFLNFDF